MSAEPQYRRGDGAAIRIYREAVQNKFQSEQAGRPIFDEAVMGEIITPGSSSNIPVFELKRTFRDNSVTFGSKYEELKEYVQAFESNDVAAGLQGTPLSEWPEMSVSLIATLKAAGVHTVDALASLPDVNLSIIGPDGRQYREKAKAFLDKASGTAEYTALAAENLVLKQELETQKAQVADMNAKLEALMAQSGAGDVSANPFPSLDSTPEVVEKTTKKAEATEAPII
jgi:hypothetical protein